MAAAVVVVLEVGVALEVAAVVVPEVGVVLEARKNNSWAEIMMFTGGMDKLVLSVPAWCLWIQFNKVYFCFILLR